MSISQSGSFEATRHLPWQERLAGVWSLLRAALERAFEFGKNSVRGPLASQSASNSLFPLLRFFAVAGFLVTSVASVVLVVHNSAHHSTSLIRMAESQNSALGRAFSNEILLEYGTYLGSVGNLSGDALRARPETTLIDARLRDLVAGLSVLKVKIYNTEGLTIYSSEPAQIGERKVGSLGFQKATTTRSPVSKASTRGQFSAFSGIVANVDLAETYVPIVSPAGDVRFVFELYSDITDQTQYMSRAEFIESTITVAVLFSMFFGMLLVVYGARKVMAHQHEAVANANAELVAANGTVASLNKALEEKVLQLERSNRDLKDFAHVAAHDMQEPLRKIEAFGQRLMSRYGDKLPDDGRMFVERMSDASMRMRSLITALLAFARLDKGERSFGDVDLNDTAKEVLSDLQVRIEETHADVTIEPLPTVVGDPAQMRQLLQNLIANALKFTRKGVPPAVRVTSRSVCCNEGRPWHEFSVADNGIGFDEKHTAMLFTLFKRLHGRSEYEGTGVGLATCRRIAERHGGSIVAVGVPDGGATFTVRLPASPPDPEAG
jgi:signal transduction histidine kinase